jgi:uncharacterized protein YecE (DUF72 family)
MEELGWIRGNIPIRPVASAVTLSLRHATSLHRVPVCLFASEGRLGAVLVQFPVSFKNADDTRDYLFSLVRKFSQYPLVLEIRHESWNDPEILGRLAEEGVGFCNIDQP